VTTKTKNANNLEKLKLQLIPILRRHHVNRAGIFGSTANGTAKKTSDIDLLIEFTGEKSLFDLVALKLDLEAEIDRKIDIQTYKALNPLIRNSVLADEVRVL
jgi:predicted nucleotidyltransferase